MLLVGFCFAQLSSKAPTPPKIHADPQEPWFSLLSNAISGRQENTLSVGAADRARTPPPIFSLPWDSVFAPLGGAISCDFGIVNCII